MTRPTYGELLRGVRIGLEGAVLPALPAGSALRQLRAALTLLRRLERSWDRRVPYLASDVADVTASLAAIASPLAGGDDEAAACARGVLDRMKDRPPVRLDDSDAAAAVERLDASHLVLRQEIVDLERAVRRDRSLDATRRADALARFAALHRRMLVRELRALGLDAPARPAPGTRGDTR